MSAILRPVRPGRLYVELAATPEDVVESQRLRYRVFASEMGAVLQGRSEGLDEDRFDPHCRHLLVREPATGRVVASTRLLDDEGARLAGGFYSESEFDLALIRRLRGSKLEIGRTCVDPGYRKGAAIAVLWSGLASYIRMKQIDFLFGCASIEMDDGGIRAAALMSRLRTHAFSPEDRRVLPRRPLPDSSAVDKDVIAVFPPLLKAYVNLGAKACGEACLDEDFGVADVFMLLDVNELDATYSRHFMARAGE